MPKVGKKEFSYSKAGMKAAKMEAKKTGKPMKMDKSKMKHEKSEGKKERMMEYGKKPKKKK